jgi:hypothetical protein
MALSMLAAAVEILTMVVAQAPAVTVGEEVVHQAQWQDL